MAYKHPYQSAYSLDEHDDYPVQRGWQQDPSRPAYPHQPAWQYRSGRGNFPPSLGQPQYDTPPVNTRRQRFNPKTWTKRTIVLVGIAVLVLLAIIIIVAVVEGIKANRYPDYTPLNYSQVDSYAPDNFFDNFNYWDTYDPADGFVHYDNPTDAQSRNLTFSGSNSAILRVDNSLTDPASTNAVTGRHSARVYSKATYNNGLFLFDIIHTPYGCGTWPAVWLSDQFNWPTNGEIDVIESVNQGNDGNQMTLHTSSGCSMSVKRKETGKSLQSSCVNSTNANAGCGVQSSVSTYGADLNAAGGGVYALELRSAGIRVWFFPRASLPSDVATAIQPSSSAAPSPASWGEALADFPSTDCNIGDHFKNQTIIVNIDICGIWAGKESVYTQADNCPGTCQQYVTTNPANFNEAYWEFGGFKVYQAPGA